MANKMVSFATLLSACATLVSGVAAAGEQSGPGVQGEEFLGDVVISTLLKSRSNNFMYSAISPEDLRSNCIFFLFEEMDARGLKANSDLRSEYMNLVAREKANPLGIHPQCIGAIDYAKKKDEGRGASYDAFRDFVEKESAIYVDLWKREPTFTEVAHAKRSDNLDVFKKGISAPMMRMIATVQAAGAAWNAEEMTTGLVLELKAKIYFLQRLMTAVADQRTEHSVPYYTQLTPDELREICILSVFDVLKKELKRPDRDSKIDPVQADQIHKKYIKDLRDKRPANKAEAYKECLGAFEKVKSISDYQSLVRIQGEIYLEAYTLVDSCVKYPSLEDYRNPTQEKVKECLGRRTPERAKAIIALQLARLVTSPKATATDVQAEPEKEVHEADSELLGLYNFIDRKPLSSGETLKYDPKPYYKEFQ